MRAVTAISASLFARALAEQPHQYPRQMQNHGGTQRGNQSTKGFDYQQYMQSQGGSQRGKQSANSFDYQQYMQGQSGGQGASGFDYQQYMQGQSGGQGKNAGFDYQVYMTQFVPGGLREKITRQIHAALENATARLENSSVAVANATNVTNATAGARTNAAMAEKYMQAGGWEHFLPGVSSQASSGSAKANGASNDVKSKLYAEDGAAAKQTKAARAEEDRAKAAEAAAARAKAAAAAEAMARAKAAMAAEAAAKAKAAAAAKAAEAAEAATGSSPSASAVELASIPQTGDSFAFLSIVGAGAAAVSSLVMIAVAAARRRTVDTDDHYVGLLREL